MNQHKSKSYILYNFTRIGCILCIIGALLIMLADNPLTYVCLYASIAGLLLVGLTWTC